MIRLRGFLSLTWVELKLYVRDPFATVVTLAFPLIVLLTLCSVFGETTEALVRDGELVYRGVEPEDYYTAASIGLVVSAVGFLSLPIHLAGYRELGVLKRLHASSVPGWTLFGAQLIVGVVVSALGSLLTLATTAVIYDVRFPERPGGVVAAFALANLAFTGIGFLLASLTKTARAAQGLSILVYLISLLLSGATMPRLMLPETARTIGNAIPLTHVVTILQDPWFGYGWNGEHLVYVALFTVASAVPALVFFRWD